MVQPCACRVVGSDRGQDPTGSEAALRDSCSHARRCAGNRAANRTKRSTRVPPHLMRISKRSREAQVPVCGQAQSDQLPTPLLPRLRAARPTARSSQHRLEPRTQRECRQERALAQVSLPGEALWLCAQSKDPRMHCLRLRRPAQTAEIAYRRPVSASGASASALTSVRSCYGWRGSMCPRALQRLSQGTTHDDHKDTRTRSAGVCFQIATNIPFTRFEGNWSSAIRTCWPPIGCDV